jgi:osmoprotectant transport system permease protein
MRLATIVALVIAAWLAHAESADGPLVIGSKNFNESYVLAEIMAQLLEGEGFEVERRFGLGGTLVCYQALVTGEVDAYVEYTGTLAQAILKIGDLAPGEDELNRLLEPVDLEVLPSIGFNNTYALAIKQTLAEAEGIETISDLVGRPDLDMGFSLEFLNRNDGWPGLVATYGFERIPTGIEHGLAYQAIAEDKLDVTDAYSTDGDLERYGLITLEDDRGLFPQYFAVPFVRQDMPDAAKAMLASLAGRIDNERMRELNAQIVVEGRSFAEVAQGLLLEEGFAAGDIDQAQFWRTLWTNTLTHLRLTGIALGLGVLVGVPVGILVFRSRNVSRVTVYLAGLMQTIPSIALLALMIPLFGIGTVPAIAALFLYSILPILRNTITALVGIDPLLKRVAEAIGLTRSQQLRYVLIPMAMPTMLAGIKTAAIISIGTATLAAFIGAGGLGEPIVTGLALNDTDLILQGAIPAAILAIVVELLFELLERLLVKPHMLVGQLPR